MNHMAWHNHANVIVRSYARNFFANRRNGRNIDMARYGSHVVVKWDLEEYRAYHCVIPREIDVTRIGYWYYHVSDETKQLRYEGPVWHTRGGNAGCAFRLPFEKGGELDQFISFSEGRTFARHWLTAA